MRLYNLVVIFALVALAGPVAAAADDGTRIKRFHGSDGGTFVITPTNNPAVVYVHHVQHKVGVASIFGNAGNLTVMRPFSVAVGVTVTINAIQRSQQEIFRISPPIAPHSQAETPPSEAPLVYLDEDPGAYYRFDMHVDVFNEISELFGGPNNTYTLEGYWWMSPSAAAREGSVRIGGIAAELEAKS